jgi:negative regulator of flagellin synthesis FlgM
MEIRNNAEALKAFLGVSSSSSARESQALNNEEGTAQASLAGDRATLSHAGTEVSQAVSEGGVRMDKVAAIQRALAAGTYQVPAPVVAGKVIDSMIEVGWSPKA